MNLYDILMDNDVKTAIRNNMSYLIEIIPEIKYMIGFDHRHPHHHLDVWNHTLYALSLSEKDFDIRLSLLLHDIGKPFSFQDGEVRHFNNHPLVSSIMSKNILERLGYSNGYIEKICYLIRYHDEPIRKEQIEDNYELTLKLYIIQYCDAMAHNPNKLEKRKKYLEEIRIKMLEYKIKK